MTGKNLLALALSFAGGFFLIWVIVPLDLPLYKIWGLLFMGAFVWTYVVRSLLSS